MIAPRLKIIAPMGSYCMPSFVKLSQSAVTLALLSLRGYNASTKNGARFYVQDKLELIFHEHA